MKIVLKNLNYNEELPNRKVKGGRLNIKLFNQWVNEDGNRKSEPGTNR